MEVFTESEALQKALRAEVRGERLEVSGKGVALLMMSSGTFDGVDVKQFAKELLS